MKASVLLQMASITSLLFAAGHTLGGMQSWSPPGDTEVFRAMQAFRFDADGASRTYWDFYVGFGLIISVFLFTQTAVLWHLATLSNKDSLQIRSLVSALFISSMVNAVLTWRFFFAVPLVLAIAITSFLGLTLRACRLRELGSRTR